MKKLFSLLVLMLTLCTCMVAQSTDTIPYTPQGITPEGISGAITGVVKLFPNAVTYIKLWLPVVLMILVSSKLIVKAIPTPEAIKIAGPLDSILNLITVFQKDIRSLSIVFFIGISLTLSGCFLQKDCRVSNTTFTPSSQTVCVTCDSLTQDALKYIAAHTKFIAPRGK